MGSKLYKLTGILIVLYLIFSLIFYYTTGSLVGTENYIMDAILLVFALIFIFISRRKITSLSNIALVLVILLFVIELVWFMSGAFSWMTWLWPLQRAVYPTVFWVRYGLVVAGFILLIVGFLKSQNK